MIQRIRLPIFFLLSSLLFLFLQFPQPAGAARRIPEAVPKWQRWELELNSSVSYTNPIQQAEVRVLLVSPLGETNRIYGFWDGGRIWKARFKPGFPGRWQYFTMCSDTANSGLHGQSGEFLCTAPVGDSAFALHGPLQVARDQMHLEHADHTPFFWLGDAAWQAMGKATAAEWHTYVKKRQEQKFNVTLWQLPSALGPKSKPLFTGRECIAIHPDAFRELDARLLAANQSGLLNAIAPLWEIGFRPDAELPAAQAVLLLRQVLARWGAEDVAWIIAFECDSTGAQANRWQNICRAVFTPVNHAPVILLPGESFWVFDGFRSERWVNLLGFQTSSVRDENSLPWLLDGPLLQERNKLPRRPLLSILPAAANPSPVVGQSIDAEFSRRLLWWNALLTTPAGVTYAAQPVADWLGNPTDGPTWRQALDQPEAKTFAALSSTMATVDFWNLQPDSTARLATLETIPAAARPQIVTNETTTLIYWPEARTLQLAATLFPPRAKAVWRNLRTNQNQPARLVPAHQGRIELQPPAAGDWLLEIKLSPAPVGTSPATKAAK